MNAAETTFGFSLYFIFHVCGRRTNEIDFVVVRAPGFDFSVTQHRLAFAKQAFVGVSELGGGALRSRCGNLCV